MLQEKVRELETTGACMLSVSSKSTCKLVKGGCKEYYLHWVCVVEVEK